QPELPDIGGLLHTPPTVQFAQVVQLCLRLHMLDTQRIRPVRTAVADLQPVDRQAMDEPGAPPMRVPTLTFVPERSVASRIAATAGGATDPQHAAGVRIEAALSSEAV